MFDVITVAIIESQYRKGATSPPRQPQALGKRIKWYNFKALAPQLCESDIKKLGCDLKNLVQREFCGAPVVARDEA